MKPQNAMTIASVALTTAVLTILLTGSGPMEAGSETLAAKIATPTLTVQGVELTLTADREFQAGDEPTLQLKAVNTAGQPVTLHVEVVMTTSAPADRMSRMVVMPSVLCRLPQALELGAHETKSITIATQTKLPAGQLVSIALQPTAQAGIEALRIAAP